MPDQPKGPRHPFQPVVPRVLTERQALQNYATVAQNYNDFIEHRLPKLEERVEAIETLVREFIDRKPPSFPPAHAQHLGTPRFNPDHTPMGGIRIDPAQWDGILQRFNEIEEAKRIEEAKASGAREALATLEKSATQTRDRLMWWVKFLSILIPLVGIVAGALTHWAHLATEEADSKKIQQLQLMNTAEHAK